MASKTSKKLKAVTPQGPMPKPAGGDLEECWMVLKKLDGMITMLAAINPNADFCISQADMSEVFGVLHESEACWPLSHRDGPRDTVIQVFIDYRHASVGSEVSQRSNLAINRLPLPLIVGAYSGVKGST